jgi:hypothetical protein
MFTPKKTGNVLVMFSAYATLGTLAADNGLAIKIAYAAGASGPAYKNAATGSTGQISEWTYDGSSGAVAADIHQPINSQWLITGLSVGTAYWFDVQLAGITAAAAATLNAPVITVIELP